jgi:hypothetical protein
MARYSLFSGKSLFLQCVKCTCTDRNRYTNKQKYREKKEKKISKGIVSVDPFSLSWVSPKEIWKIASVLGGIFKRTLFLKSPSINF